MIAAHELFIELLNKNITVRVKVTGTSMRPCVPSGAIVALKKTSPETVRIGELIAFRTSEGTMVLHRVLRKKHTPKGWQFQTKGDARADWDRPILDAQVFGKVCCLEHPSSGQIWDLNSPGWLVVNRGLAMVHGLKTTMLKKGLLKIWRIGVGWALSHS